MIFSTSAVVGLQNYQDSYYFIKKHFLHLFLGFFLFGFAYVYPYRKYERWAMPGIVVALFFLLLTYVPGIKVISGGAARWINLGFFSFQPSEFAKFFVIIFVAFAARNKREKITDFFQGILPILCLIGMIALLVLKQPSLGSTVVIVTTTLAMLFIAGASFWQLLFLGLVGFRVIAWLVTRTPYQMRRFLAYLDPWKNSMGIGFQTVQSLLAIGSGGFLGLGLGQSKQKFSYLPQQYTDFIFSILCEELGFIGGLLTVLLFGLFILRAVRIAAHAPDRFGQLLAAGLTFSIGIQAIINLFVVTGMVPTTGIPLPFISYGGSNLLMNLFFVGILTQISRYYEEPVKKEERA